MFLPSVGKLLLDCMASSQKMAIICTKNVLDLLELRHAYCNTKRRLSNIVYEEYQSHNILDSCSNAYPCKTGRYLVELYKVMIIPFIHVLIYCEQTD
jgi:hypothetical protein